MSRVLQWPDNISKHRFMQSFERLDSISRWLLISLAGLLPFFILPLSWITTAQSKIALSAILVLIAAVLWIIARIMEGGVRLPWNLTLGAVALLPLSYAISTVVSGASAVSLVGTGLESDTLAFVCVEFGALVLAASLFSTNQNAIIVALRAFVLGTLALTLLQIFHIAFPSISLGGTFASATGNAFGSWHSFALIVGLGAYFSLALARSASSRLWSYVYYLTAILAAGGLIVANFVDVWIMLALALFAHAAVLGWRERMLATSAYWGREWKFVVAIIIAAFFVVFGTFVVNVLPERIQTAQLEVRPSWQGTLAIGGQTLDSPLTLLFGSGPNTFTRVWGLHKPVQVNESPYWNAAFNAGVASIPTSFITVGIVGVLAWILSILALIVVVIRLWMARGAHIPSPALALSIASLALAASHVFFVPDPAVTLLMFVVIGVFLASAVNVLYPARYLALRGAGWEGRGHLAGLIVCSLIVIVAVGALSRVILAQTYLNRAIVTYNTTGDVQVASGLVTTALRIYPSDRSHRAAVELGLLELQQLIASPDAEAEAARTQLQATLERTIQHGLTAVELGGGDYQNWLELAGIYSQLAGADVEGAYENARGAYARAFENNPTSPLPLMNLAQLEIVRNQPDAALEYLARALELKPNLAAAYYLASQIYAGKKDFTTALSTAARAAELAPNDSQAWYNAGAIAYAGADYANAAAAMERALSLQPQFANALYVLGLSYYQLQRTDEALTVFTSLDALDPGQPAVQAILAALRAGEPLPQSTQ